MTMATLGRWKARGCYHKFASGLNCRRTPRPEWAKQTKPHEDNKEEVACLIMEGTIANMMNSRKITDLFGHWE